MDRTSVKSSHLKNVKYDEDLEELTIQFKNQAIYTFMDVSKSEVRSLMNAVSKGKSFWNNIRDEKITVLEKSGVKK